MLGWKWKSSLRIVLIGWIVLKVKLLNETNNWLIDFRFSSIFSSWPRCGCCLVITSASPRCGINVMRCFLRSWKNPPINQPQEYILHTTDQTLKHEFNCNLSTNKNLNFFSIAASFLLFTLGDMSFLEKSSFFPTFSGFVDFYRLKSRVLRLDKRNFE